MSVSFGEDAGGKGVKMDKDGRGTSGVQLGLNPDDRHTSTSHTENGQVEKAVMASTNTILVVTATSPFSIELQPRACQPHEAAPPQDGQDHVSMAGE